MSSIINSGDKFKSDILAMITSGTSNDVKILLEDGEIIANKDVLCARSDYFSTMFSSNNQVKFVEGETNTIDMSHCSKVVMDRLIKYLFSGDMTLHDLCLPDLVKMMNMTSMMMMEDTYNFIKDYILELIPDSGVNCACLPDLVISLILAKNFGLDEIREALVHELFMSLKDVPHIPEVVHNSEAFKMLPANLVKEIFLYNQLKELEDEDEDGTSDDDDDFEEIQEPNPKKTRMSPSRTKRAGIVFPVTRINRRIKKGKYAKRVGKEADVYMAAVIEYLVADLVELSGRLTVHKNRERIIPCDIKAAIALDEEFTVLNHNLSNITIPEDALEMARTMRQVEDENDKDYNQPDDTDDDDDFEVEGDDTDEDDRTDTRWVGDNDRFTAFLYWLSGNECSDEDKEEITSSFNLLCGCFTAEKLLTDVKKSGLFSGEEIDNSVLETIRHACKKIKTSEDDDKCYYLGMLANEYDYSEL